MPLASCATVTAHRFGIASRCLRALASASGRDLPLISRRSFLPTNRAAARLKING
jgi:hypothetical protein